MLAACVNVDVRIHVLCAGHKTKTGVARTLEALEARRLLPDSMLLPC